VILRLAERFGRTLSDWWLGVAPRLDAVADRRVVWLVRRRTPLSETEAVVQAALLDGALPLGRLVELATERLIETELRRSGGAAEVALWGQELFPAAIVAMVDELDGAVFRVSGRATPAPHDASPMRRRVEPGLATPSW
jgi:hypothetical protein